MVFNKIYGTQICYIREKHDMIKASLAEKLTETLVKYKDGYYIKQLTNGKYNSVFYKWQKLYYGKKSKMFSISNFNDFCSVF